MAGRVLIAEWDATHRKALEAELAAACYDVTSVEDELAFAETLETGAPDVLLIGEEMLSDAILTTLRASRGGQDTAVVGLLQSAQDRTGALMSGLDEALARPASGAFMQARLRSLIRALRRLRELRRNQIAAGTYGFAEAAPKWRAAPVVALVSDAPGQQEFWARSLGKRTTCNFSSDDILSVGRRSDPPPDVIILEIDDAPGRLGLTLLAELRNRRATVQTPVLAVVAAGAQAQAAMALDLGADDILLAPAKAPELRLRLDRVIVQQTEFEALRAPVEESLRLAAIDSLTGLFNRRYAENIMRKMVSDQRGHDVDQTVAVIIADLDHFKAVNDRFGHDEGDKVLVDVAARLREGLRPDDLLARFGGEEFLIVMRGLSPQAARAAAQRLCARVRDLCASAAGGHPITISIGVAVGTVAGSRGSLDALRCAADAALYEAKAAGRDCVRMADPHANLSRESSGKSAA